MPKLRVSIAVAMLLAALSLGQTAAWPATAAEYRRLADQCVASGQYAKAADYYRKEAAIYRRLGDPNAAKVEEIKAERWSTEIKVFVDTPPDRQTLLGLYTGAKLEPIYGCCVGAFVRHDIRLYGYGRQTLPEEVFARLTKKGLATSYDYCNYGKPFPTEWAKGLLAKGIAPHIAWEPNAGLDAVQDDRYLRKFAADAAACGGPIFVRFAGEMNGKWTGYHGQPDLYRRKFQLVHDVMAARAPNVAMIWCVNYIPEHNIDEYYPGDRYVDWVGVNFYSVMFHDNDPSKPATFENPADCLKYVYRKYASRKPIAICEYGASHMAAVDRIDKPDFAITKIRQLFAALPRLYPRVKLIDIFDCDNLKHAIPSRQLNNYCITDNAQILEAYCGAVGSDYFLSQVYTVKPLQKDCLPTHIKVLADGAALAGKVRLSAWVKTYESAPTVVYSIDGKTIAGLDSVGDYSVELDTSVYPKGKHTLAVTVTDSRGRVAGSKKLTVVL
jgi:hypothetical protein